MVPGIPAEVPARHGGGFQKRRLIGGYKCINPRWMATVTASVRSAA